MKKRFKVISIILTLFMCFFIFVSCSVKKSPSTSDTGKTGKNLSYIKVDGSDLNKEYIGYFFYVAQRNMILEAGMVLGEGGNSTEADVAEFWKTTEIEGRKAVEVARDLAAENAVMQTVQYLKAKSEGITLSQQEEENITRQINDASDTSGGTEAFKKRLSEMGCSIDAYRQILTENLYVNKLYQKYDAEGKLDITDDELAAFTRDNDGIIAPENMLDSAKKDKFNAMSHTWKTDFNVVIDDENMKNFNVK